jgi:hypothetical protein
MAYFMRLTLNTEGKVTACVNMDHVVSMQDANQGYTALRLRDGTSLSVKESTATIMGRIPQDHRESVV